MQGGAVGARRRARSTCCASPRPHVTDRGASARAGRLVVLAALAGVLTPVSLVACSAAALVALVVYEIRLRLAEQDA